ncbi:MAG: hypothetical protein MUD03_01835 [Pirellula sp.]|jgi:hypothetical protein|nr:hypothetical protein [Pirellula sp.]
MITNWIRRVGLGAVIAGSVMAVGASTAEAGGYQVRSRYGYYGPRTYYGPSYRVYRPAIVAPGYGYYPYGPGISINTYPNYYRSYRVSPALPWGGYGVGGYPPGASWGGGSNRGFSLYIGR